MVGVDSMRLRLLSSLIAATAMALCACRSSYAGHGGDAGYRGDAGLASKYLNDQGLAKDPDVILFQDYEVAKIDDLKKQGWSWSRPKDGVYELCEDAKKAFAGRGCLQKNTIAGKNGAIMPVDLKPRESSPVYHRMYTYVPSGCPNVRVMGITGVNQGMPTWKAIGSAGVRPTGTNYYCVTLTLQAKGGTLYPMWYPYHMDQKGPWGDNWWVETPVPMDRWFCLEFMVKLNAPGQKNGELRMWIDGKEAFARTDMRYRSVESLKTSMIFDQCYSSKSFKNSATMYADNRVVARKYVGPMLKEKPEPFAETRTPDAPPKPDAAAAANAKAARMYRSARTAERQGMKSLAKRIYEKIVKDYPDSDVAAEARKRLE